MRIFDKKDFRKGGMDVMKKPNLSGIAFYVVMFVVDIAVLVMITKLTEKKAD